MYLVMTDITPYSPYPKDSSDSAMAKAVGCSGTIIFTTTSLPAAMKFLASYDFKSMEGDSYKSRLVSSSPVCKIFETCLKEFPYPDEDDESDDEPNTQDVFIVKV